ncbi:MAG: response regulator transcription factor [bacterium]|nr:response regulator transcription factor [bacterium]MCY3925062.1 response regulator transcription factor [bacterium]
MSRQTIFVAEDDPAIGTALQRTLNHEGYDVRRAADGAEALETLARMKADLIILDVAMPYIDGLAVCRRLRRAGNRTPVLMLTARDTIGDRVEGLDAGADDYLVKPFSLDELCARIRALLRRASVTGVEPSADRRDVLRVADLELDRAGRTVHRGDRLVHLTKTEFDLLELLVHNKGIVLSRDTIYERVWGFDFETGSKSLDIYIGYLRRKLEADGCERLLHTVRGVGYVAREP